MVDTDLAHIAAGGKTTLNINRYGSSLATVANTYGQHGNGSTAATSIPIEIATDVVDASVGTGYVLLVKNDGTLWAAGLNTSGQLGDGTTAPRTSPVRIASDVVAAAAARTHSLFLKSDGSLWGMGYNWTGALGDGTGIDRVLPIQIATGVARIAAGHEHSLFIKADRTLWGMGCDLFGSFNVDRSPVFIAADVVEVAAGHNHSLFVTSDGTLWGMGQTINTQRNVSSSFLPTPPAEIATAVSAISAGRAHSLFLKNDGSLWAWGAYAPLIYFSIPGSSTPFSIQAASGDAIPTYAIPTQVAAQVVAIASGGDHDVFLSPSPVILNQPETTFVLPGESATLSVVASAEGPLAYQWFIGPVGDTGEPFADATGPTLITGPITEPRDFWVRVWNGDDFVDSIKATVAPSHPPVVIAPPSVVTRAGRPSVAFTANVGSTAPLAYQWYFGESGDTTTPITGADGRVLVISPVGPSARFWARATSEVGSIDTPSADSPILLPAQAEAHLWTVARDGSSPTRQLTPAVGDVSHVSINRSHGLRLKTDRSLWTYGSYSVQPFAPSTLFLLSANVGNMAAGGSHDLYIDVGARLWSVGKNHEGQLADGTTIERSQPVQIATDVVQVSAGQSHTLFLVSDGTLWAAGANTHGQLGDGTTTRRASPVLVATDVAEISAGDLHSLFIKTDGSLWAMGYNLYGQLGDGTTVNRLSPVEVASDALMIAAGWTHSLYVKTDGSLWATGDNTHGQLGDDTVASRSTPGLIANDVRQVEAGDCVSYYLTNDRVLHGMGDLYGEKLYPSYQPTSETVEIDRGVARIANADSHGHYLGFKPAIAVPPASGSLVQGLSRTLAVSPVGVGPFSFQWFVGISSDATSPISGATHSSLTIRPQTTTTYWVRVTNDHGSTGSRQATISVILPADTDSDGLPDAWELVHGLNHNTAESAHGRLGDPDGDGLPNLLEHAFGFSPTEADTRPPFSSTAVRPDPETGAPCLTLTYRRLIYRGALIYSVVTSTDLTTWSTPSSLEVLSVEPNDDGLTETVTVKLPQEPNGDRGFVRLEVTTL